MKLSIHEEKAKALFMEGYNCTQSVVLAFRDDMGMDREEALKLASPFGAGLGGMREVCGTVSGMMLVIGHFYGYADPKDFEAKKQLYARVQDLADRFRQINGSIICHELLHLEKGARPAPQERSKEYYQKRPCPELCGIAARLVDEYMEENPV